MKEVLFWTTTGFSAPYHSLHMPSRSVTFEKFIRYFLKAAAAAAKFKPPS